MSSNTFLLGKWLELADDAFQTSKKLMYERLSKKPFKLHLPAYILHLSIELYLKAFLMNNNVFFNHGTKGHDLNFLFDKCLSIKPDLDTICLQSTNSKYKQSYWINHINEFGKNGGLRYLSRKRVRWNFCVLTYDYLDDLVNYINRNTDKNKVINTFI